MTTYRIIRSVNGVTLFRERRGEQREISPAASLRVHNHSPTGFEFGYGGSGSAQLALAILLDHFQSAIPAGELYQKFKWDYVAPRSENEWTITSAQIDAWANRAEAATC